MKKLFFPGMLLLFVLSCEPFELDRLEFVEIETKIIGIGNTTASLVLNISGLTNSTVARSGFVWSTITDAPTLTDNEGKKELGQKENGQINTDIDNLSADTRYVVRAYVLFAGEEIYSDPLPFTTGTVNFSIGEVQYVRGRSALITGTLMGLDLRDPVSQYGHCWSKTEQAPSLRNATCSNLGRPNTDGNFVSTLEGLQREETYFIRAYILTNFGTDTIYSEKTLTYTTDLVDVWHSIAPLPASARGAAAGFVIGDTAYVGLGNRFDDNHPDKQFYAYDYKNDKWTSSGEEYKGGDIRLVPSFVIGNTAYVGSLYADDRMLYRFDPQVGIWEETVPFPGQTRDHNLSFSINGKGYMGLGKGKVRVNGNRPDLNDFYEFDPKANGGKGGWTEVTVGQLPKGAYAWGETGFAIGSPVNKGYMVGGSHPASNQVWEFTPGSGWKQKKDFPGGPTDWAVGFSIGNKGYIGTGIEYGLLYSGIFWEYDPDRDDWTRKADFPGDYRRYATGFSLNGKGYIGAGDFGLETKNDFWEYTPEK